MKNNIKEALKLYLVTDSEILKGRDFYQSIEEAIKGGITMVQLREKDASGKEFLEKAIRLREITKKYNVKFIINDRVDIAILSDADGVHVGQSDISAKYVRELVGPNKIVGVSVGDINEAICARYNGADYIGVGAMFTTSTKLDAKCVSFETVKEIRGNLDIPMVLIGGISLGNLEEVKRLDSDGYAIVSAILKSEDIRLETQKWIEKI